MAACTLDVTSEEVADFIDRYNNETDEEIQKRLNTDCIDYASTEYVITHYPISTILPISINNYGYSRIPKIYGLLDTTAPRSAGITQALDNPNLGASGKGVIIGFIDTGIDYQNPLFRNADGTSRILGIWDQTIAPASPEENPFFLYGTVYNQMQINQALASPDPLSVVPTVDTNGHGTFMAGVAAGNRSVNDNFTGASPDCMIAAVKLKPAKRYLRDYFLISSDAPAFQENDIMLAVQYLVQISIFHRAPIVIYLGVGTNQGNHTGTSPLGLQLQDLSVPYGVSFVTGAGNETGLHHHYLGSLKADEVFEDVEIRVAEGENGFCLELWGSSPELYTVGFVSPSGEVIERLPDISGSESVIPFRLDQATVTVSYLHVESGSGSSLVFMRFQNPSAGIWHLRVYPSVFFTGNYHIWMPMNGFIDEGTIFLRPDPDTIVTDPGNSVYAFTIAAYDHISDQIYIHSSRGFNLNDAIVPVIAAPGVNVYGPLPTASTTGGQISGDSTRAISGAGPVTGNGITPPSQTTAGTGPTAVTGAAAGAGTTAATGATAATGTAAATGAAAATGTAAATGATAADATAAINTNTGTTVAIGVTAPTGAATGPIEITVTTGAANPTGTATAASTMPAVQYTRKSGTSVAAAMAAGAVANLFSWSNSQDNHFTLSSASVHAFFIRGARRNPALVYPNREWGYGALDLYQSFLYV